ncbi:long-chain fatty acid--CoA ligase, partial [Streptomyces sp. SID11233]|nr:long-chain fatty acid--CoA ligase [Streptomyces sp. SID11233]
LMRLATHTGLVETRLPELRVIASGGSALPADAADLLTKHFEVPVLQGYGLAETSPLTHSDEPVLPLRG